MTEPFMGEIQLFAFGFAPKGWAPCAGQLLPIQQNTALFSLLGTFYGGDGIRTFALPNMQGRVPLHFGDSYVIGEQGGTTNVTLTIADMPLHTHLVNANTAAGNQSSPANTLLAGAGIYETVKTSVALNAAVIQPAGGNQPHTNVQPYLALNFCIALNGIFPSRS